MAALVAAHDWAATPLGPRESWPPSLRTTVELVLAHPVAMVVLWGADLVQIYNDGYRVIAAGKHPAALGRPSRECWPEAWAFNAPVCARVRNGEAVSFQDQKLTVERDGRPEDAWFDLAYSPVREENGAVGGVLVTVVETTARVRADEESARARTALEAGNAALRREAAVLAAVLESVPDGVYAGGMDGIWLCNRAGLDQLGFDSVEQLRRRVGDLARQIETRDPDTGAFIPEDRQAFVRALGGQHDLQTVAVRHLRTGAERLVRCAAAPVRLDDAVIGAVAVNSDITEARQREMALRASEERFRTFFDAAPQIAWLLRPDGGVEQFNGRWRAYTGLPVRPDGAAWLAAVHPDDREAVRTIRDRAIAAGLPYEIELRLRRAADGEWRWHLGRVVPLDAADGPGGWLGTAFDIHNRKMVEQALAASEHRKREILESINEGYYRLDTEWRFVEVNRRFEALSGMDRDALLGRKVWEVFPDAHDAESYGEFFPERRAAVFERHSNALGGWFEVTVYRGPDGVEVYFRDIGERKRAEEHQKLLLAELSHRVKNTLASVLSITSQTLRTSPSPAAFQTAFTGRLAALAQAHNLLSQGNWEGADLEAVARAELSPHLGAGSGRLTVDGPTFRLPPRAALAFGMVFHELATNAAKYGALSAPSGRVGIAWTVRPAEGGRLLCVRWTETGGPMVEPPTRRGFGSTLIERGLAHELDGRVTLAFPPEGVRCTMEVPLGPET